MVQVGSSLAAANAAVAKDAADESLAHPQNDSSTQVLYPLVHVSQHVHVHLADCRRQHAWPQLLATLPELAIKHTSARIYHGFSVCAFYWSLQINVKCQRTHMTICCCISNTLIPYYH